MKTEYLDIARRSLLLSAAPAEITQELLASAHLNRFERGSTVFMQGERADAVYIVAEGWAKLYRMAPSGTEAVVGVFTRGQSFGEAVALHHDTYPVSAEAVTDCTLIRIEADLILRLLRDEPELAIAMLTATYVHLHALVAQLEAMKAQTGPQRVAEFLLELCDGTCGACTVTLPYDKVLIAGRLGMKPESLSRAFAKLRGEGVTMRQNKALIADIEALRAYAEEDPANAWSRA